MEKRYFISTLIVFILGLSLWIGLVIYFDPSQQLRITNYPFGDPRVINPGLAKNYNYDIVILGSSTSENILKKDVDSLYNGNSINLSLSGTTNYEQRQLLEIILKKNPTKIIYGLDYFVFNKELKQSRVKLEKFAFENSYLELYRYIFNFSTFKGVALAVLKFSQIKKINKNWIYIHSYWGDDFEYSEQNTRSFNKNTVSGGQNIGIVSELKNGYYLELMKKNFDTFYELLKDNENTEFLIYYPPYANIWWDYAREYGCEETILKFKEYISYKTMNLKNVKLYDFQKVDSIVENLDNYRDMVHFSPSVSKSIVQDMRVDNYRVYPAN